LRACPIFFLKGKENFFAGFCSERAEQRASLFLTDGQNFFPKTPFLYDFSVICGLYLFIKRAFETTLTDENAIAAAAITGFKSQPVKGYKIPAATGIPTIL